jgi:hypothetical protein
MAREDLMTPERLVQMLIDADMMPFAYSGRGMYGRECVAVSGDVSPFDLGLRIGLALGRRGHEEMELRSATDAMGRGVVLYFPDATWSDKCAALVPDDEDEVA